MERGQHLCRAACGQAHLPRCVGTVCAGLPRGLRIAHSRCMGSVCAKLLVGQGALCVKRQSCHYRLWWRCVRHQRAISCPNCAARALCWPSAPEPWLVFPIACQSSSVWASALPPSCLSSLRCGAPGAPTLPVPLCCVGRRWRVHTVWAGARACMLCGLAGASACSCTNQRRSQSTAPALPAHPVVSICLALGGRH